MNQRWRLRLRRLSPRSELAQPHVDKDYIGVLPVIPRLRAKRQKLVRTSIALPASLKRRMDQSDLNWSQVAREAIAAKLEEGCSNVAEAVLLNERLRRKAPPGWDSTRVIKQWRSAR